MKSTSVDIHAQRPHARKSPEASRTNSEAGGPRTSGGVAPPTDEGPRRSAAVPTTSRTTSGPTREPASAANESAAGTPPAEAEDELAEAIAAMRSGGHVEPTKTKVIVGRFLTDWMDRKADDDLKPTTAASYRQKIDQHLIPRLGSLRMHKLDVARVEDALRDIHREGGVNGWVHHRARTGVEPPRASLSVGDLARGTTDLQRSANAGDYAACSRRIRSRPSPRSSRSTAAPASRPLIRRSAL